MGEVREIFSRIRVFVWRLGQFRGWKSKIFFNLLGGSFLITCDIIYRLIRMNVRDRIFYWIYLSLIIGTIFQRSV